MILKSFKQYVLTEGGNVFDNTSSIKKEYIENTVKEYFKELGSVFPNHKASFSLDKFKLLGSAGKKDVSGDIDIAVDSKTLVDDHNFTDELLKSWNINKDEFEKRFEKIRKSARTATEEMSKYKAFMQLLGEYINKKSETIQVDEKKISNGNLFGSFPQYDEKNKKTDLRVQIDWNVGNLDWLTFSYHSDVYEGNVKGLHRTQLMLSMFDAKDLSFNHVNGVKNKNTQEILATNPEEAIKILNDSYNTNLTKETVANYFTLFEVVNKLPKKDKEKVFDIYLKILDKTRTDIPDNLQKYWIKNQDRLNLTGKFLPDDSKLKGYIK